eukprot:346487-Amphidinium_carterae.1
MGNDKIVEHRSGDNILSPVSLILKLLAKWKHLGLLGDEGCTELRYPPPPVNSHNPVHWVK